MRYEKKYRIESASLPQVRQAILDNPASFKKAYPDRYVNSIYLDSPQFDAFNDNLSGISNRVKYRIRWYGKDWTVAEKPILEKKIKENDLGTKEFFPFPSFKIGPDFDLLGLIASDAAFLRDLRPVVLVRYLRSYFVSFDGRVRATIDREMCYALYNGNMLFGYHFSADPAIVLEVKFDQELRDKSDYIVQALPFRLTKNSKFVSGVVSHYY